MNTGEASLQALRSLVVDRTSPVPLYFQVAQHLERAIDSGDLPPGTLLLNEVDLAETLKLSRPTMRRAIQSLVEKGLVVRRRGVGTRVVQPKMRRPLGLASLYEDLARSGRTPTTKVLSLGAVGANDEVATALAVEPGSPVVELVRLRSANRKPIAKMTNFLPARFAGITESDLAGGGLYDLLRAQGIVLHSAVQTVGACTAEREDAELLQEPEGAALLTAQRTTYDDHGDAVEYGTHLYAASRYSIEIGLLTV